MIFLTSGGFAERAGTPVMKLPAARDVAASNAWSWIPDTAVNRDG
jgi:hypothetical protein